MSGRLYAFDEGALLRVLGELNSIAASGDAVRWSAFWSVRRAELLNAGAPEHLTPGQLPHPDSQDWLQLRRAAATSSALCREFLVEKHWHVHYPDLSDDEAGFPVSESDEYEAVGRHIFAAGTMPPGLECLDERPAVATNWISHESVQQLWAMEQTEGFLATVGQTLISGGVPLGYDLLTVRKMLEFAAQHMAALYLWDPGT